MEPNQPRRRSLVFPILLVGVGLYLLAHNLGWIETSPWKAMATLWPLFLVAIGLDLLLGRARLWVTLLVGGLFTLVCLALFHTGTFVHRAFRDQPLETRKFEVALDNAPAGVLELDLDLSEMKLAALPAGSPRLIEGEVRTGPFAGGLDFHETTGDAGKTVTVRFEPKGRGPRVHFWGWDEERSMDLRLSPDVPLDLRLDLNAGTGDLDLSALKVKRLEAELNAGTGTVRLSPGVAEGAAELEVSVGTLELEVPAGCAARLRVDGALSTTDVDRDRFPADGEEYRSADWETATCKWDIAVRGNLSTLTLK